MPIYEYRCQTCKRKVSILYRSFSAAAAGGKPCPRCGSPNLARLISRVRVMRGVGGGDADGDDAGEFGDDLGGDDELTAMMAGLDQSDPRSLARAARRMAAESGEDLEPELDTALTRIERGENPDRVLADFDESDISGMDDGGLDDDGMIYS